MPLHLLHTKSWNVYAPKNIERVKKDKAELQAREEEHDRKLDEYDAAKRAAILRGEEPPPPPPELEQPERKHSDDEERRRVRDDKKRWRRRHGEDDTDRDLRLAREDLGRPGKHQEKRGEKRKRSDAPITDRDGYTNLFPEEQRKSKEVARRDPKVEADKSRKDRDLEDQSTMRFSNAAGRDGLKKGPWYAEKARQRAEMEFIEGKDVWGRPDEKAKRREEKRQVSNDPLAMMKKAQVQFKQAEKDKRDYVDEKLKDIGLEPETSRDHHRRHRGDSRERRRRRDEGREERYRHRDRDRARNRRDDDERRREKKRRRREEERKSGTRLEEPDDFRLDA